MSKSIVAKIEEIILKFTKPDYMDSFEKVNEFLENRPHSNSPIKSIFRDFDFDGIQVFTFGDKNADNIIVYMHGGAYVNEINWQHFLFCLAMSRKWDAYVLAPVYPLAPHHKAIETFEIVAKLYGEIIQNPADITLMGDSAGGGFVLSFAQYLKTIDLPQPDNIVAFSPWVDVSMSNQPYDSANDPILGEIGLKEIGKSWAGNLDTDDFRVSPIFGDNGGMAKTVIFAGENEIFYKDIKKYVENLKKDGVDVKFFIGNGLFHIYPLFPMPEARKAFKQLKKEILG